MRVLLNVEHKIPIKLRGELRPSKIAPLLVLRQRVMTRRNASGGVQRSSKINGCPLYLDRDKLAKT